jgi:hypothetical protein
MNVDIDFEAKNQFDNKRHIMYPQIRSRKTEINGRGESLRWPRNTLYLLKLALTSPTSGGRSVGRYSSLADYTSQQKT